MVFLNAVVKLIAPIFIITSPITSYADQIYSIHRTRSSTGFSLDIPLIMLVASILKVYYWFGAHFSRALLLQAILMIGIQLLLLHVALTHRPPPTHHTPFAAHPSPRPYGFWQWRSVKPYWSFLTYLTVSLLALHVLFSATSLFIPYTEMLGLVALAIEATLPLPQLWANQKRRGCKGFRVSVVANWLVGDVFKMWFFFAQGEGEGGVPIAFKLCGVFQMCCDVGLGVQWWIFGDGPEDLGVGKTKEAVGNGFLKGDGFTNGIPEKGVPLEMTMEGWQRTRVV
ncbi:hypothetical protein K432DRAFT_433648 [Lepidopterella palustris CBS 459.81]|uniref:PQ loop repeat protein n=1 Tax=Lepidopterella palustris CBS 459.81 TaxID=1314670 RepID=A0A8E2EEB9_9PEZI|nr:hypothetical protein K432DRAFT_433648 [Lepidopterella palustris CBS 459.81]